VGGCSAILSTRRRLTTSPHDACDPAGADGAEFIVANGTLRENGHHHHDDGD